MKADPRLMTLVAGAGILSTWITLAAVNTETDSADYSGVATMAQPPRAAAAIPPKREDQGTIAEVAFGGLD